MLDGLLINFALLIASMCVVSLTYNRIEDIESPSLRVWRWWLCVGTSLLLLGHAVPVAHGVLFDFRAVPIALISRRGGTLWGLLGAACVIAYRLYLGGEGVLAAILNLLLVALVAGVTTNAARRHETDLYRVWWVPLTIFFIGNAPVLLALRGAGIGMPASIGLYVLGSLLGAAAMMAAHLVTQTRINLVRYAAMLERHAHTDLLTGAFNRRQFNADTDQSPQSAYLLLLDIDHFKRVNDTYGHDAGDQVLVAVARSLREHARPTDRVYRLGGEEFAVLLCHCEEAAAPLVAARLRRGVEGSVASLAGLPGECITMSGGLVALGPDRRQTLRQADALLYAAKNAGRNRVVFEGDHAVARPDAALEAAQKSVSATR